MLSAALVVVLAGRGVVVVSFAGLIKFAVDAVTPDALKRISGFVLWPCSRANLLVESKSRLATFAPGDEADSVGCASCAFLSLEPVSAFRDMVEIGVVS